MLTVILTLMLDLKVQLLVNGHGNSNSNVVIRFNSIIVSSSVNGYVGQ